MKSYPFKKVLPTRNFETKRCHILLFNAHNAKHALEHNILNIFWKIVTELKSDSRNNLFVK